MYIVKSLQVLNCACTSIVSTDSGYVVSSIGTADTSRRIEAHLIDEDSEEEIVVSGYATISYKATRRGIFKGVAGGEFDLRIINEGSRDDHYQLHVTDRSAQSALISAFGENED